MNRKERRAQAAKAKSENVDPVVSVHEAGHAVARYLTAGEMGLQVNEAVAYIEVGGSEHLGTSVDGKMELRSQAVTYGPILSAELMEIFTRETTGRDNLTEQDIMNAVKIGRAEGVDIDKWLRARMLIAVFGAAAEAGYTRKPLIEVFESYSCEDDQRGAVKDGLYAGLTTEQIQTFIDKAMERAVDLFKRDDLRSAISAVARIIPASGRVSGRHVSQVIKLHIQS